jgi:hypothetical protein
MESRLQKLESRALQTLSSNINNDSLPNNEALKGFGAPVISQEDRSQTFESPTFSFGDPALSQDTQFSTFDKPCFGFKTPVFSQDKQCPAFDQSLIKFSEPAGPEGTVKDRHLNKENIDPNIHPPKVDNFAGMTEMGRELSMIKAELETTRRKLAEYEARPPEHVAQRSVNLEYNTDNCNARFNPTSFGLSQNDIFTWPRYEQKYQAPAPPLQPPQLDIAVPVPPVHLPPSISPVPPNDVASTNPGKTLLYCSNSRESFSFRA